MHNSESDPVRLDKNKQRRQNPKSAQELQRSTRAAASIYKRQKGLPNYSTAAFVAGLTLFGGSGKSHKSVTVVADITLDSGTDENHQIGRGDILLPNVVR
jgi:hypothetical protein